MITPRTKAIVLVDLYGGFPDLLGFEALAAEHGIALIEDAAEAAGGWHAGRAAGSFGRVSTFSFHGSKTLTTGEGGMVLCDDRDLHQRMLFLRDHGRLPGDVSFRSVEVAWKYKMSELQAALGRVQLDRIDELIAEEAADLRLVPGPTRRPADRAQLRARRRARDVLDGHRRLRRGDGSDRSQVRDAFAVEGIATRPFFPPLSSLPAFASSRDTARASQANPVSYALAERGINFPSALMLSEPTSTASARPSELSLRRRREQGPTENMATPRSAHRRSFAKTTILAICVLVVLLVSMATAARPVPLEHGR